MNKLKKLDRTRDFGIVYGGGLIRFEQDGLLFNGMGIEIESEDPVAITPPYPSADPITLPAVEDPPIDAPVISVEYKPLNLVTMAQLRARYTELTGKRVRVGVSKKGIQELIIAARRVSNS